MNQITIDFSFYSILDILSISTAFMLGLLFITSKSNNKKANIFLGLFLWSLTIEIFGSFSQSVNELENYNNIQSSLFTIPFLLLYTIQTLNEKIKAYCYLLFIPGFILNFVPVENIVTKYFEYLFNILLLINITIILKKNQNRIGDFYSNIENKTFVWLKAIVYIFFTFHVLWVSEDIIELKSIKLTQYFAFLSTILTFIMIYWIGYNGFTQSDLFKFSLFINDKASLEKTYSKESFSIIYDKIEMDKLFLTSNLTLKTLSEKLDIREKELSKLINTHTNKNFYNFINQFRVNEFKKLLLSPKAKQLSILGLAEEAGFSSKSTFYSAFKNLEGITPKQYQNNVKMSE
ncbi:MULTISPECIES: helix-turn-helix domain-containing protein [Tenacibaculum]|uniref:helix-turn-helix domain-containing protein n=1 Tax=Tenacibaculum TaxID=104267 RepID=UPI0008973280|nr:helix-turn-helix domain-containing protein [Tenacibaculum sp. MAR_2010_89]SED95823.1 AraC-type DNA-binding protein [Tenacibaculum sp. MAR_2010_89]